MQPAYFLSLLLICQTSTTLSALPPGYEDLILCRAAATSCLRPHPQPHGWCGPRTAFVECCDTETGEVSRPRGWGWKVGEEYKEKLASQGWGEVKRCGGDGVCGAAKNRNVAAELASMEGVADRLIGLWGVGLW